MEFRIADTFTDSLARLALHEQKAAKTTAFDLQLNPAAPGLKFHRIDTMRPQDSSRRRRWDAIRDRRARRRLPRQHATSDHGDRRPGPAGRGRPNTNRRQDRCGGTGRPMSPANPRKQEKSGPHKAGGDPSVLSILFA